MRVAVRSLAPTTLWRSTGWSAAPRGLCLIQGPPLLRRLAAGSSRLLPRGLARPLSPALLPTFPSTSAARRSLSTGGRCPSTPSSRPPCPCAVPPRSCRPSCPALSPPSHCPGPARSPTDRSSRASRCRTTAQTSYLPTPPRTPCGRPYAEAAGRLAEALCCPALSRGQRRSPPSPKLWAARRPPPAAAVAERLRCPAGWRRRGGRAINARCAPRSSRAPPTSTATSARTRANSPTVALSVSALSPSPRTCSATCATFTRGAGRAAPPDA